MVNESTHKPATWGIPARGPENKRGCQRGPVQVRNVSPSRSRVDLRGLQKGDDRGLSCAYLKCPQCNKLLFANKLQKWCPWCLDYTRPVIEV